MDSKSLFVWLFLMLAVLLVTVFIALSDSNPSGSELNANSLRSNTASSVNSSVMITKHRRLDEYHDKMYNFNASAYSPHYKPWKVLEVVDGLKNEDVVMLITSSGIKGFHYLRERSVTS